MRETAYAKLNLALHVRGRGADGYHRIETLFAFCEDGDVLTAEPADELSLRVTGPFAVALEGDADNLVLRAARALGISDSALILDKRLPVASGIGGGSADAAATSSSAAAASRSPSSASGSCASSGSAGSTVSASRGSAESGGPLAPEPLLPSRSPPSPPRPGATQPRSRRGRPRHVALAHEPCLSSSRLILASMRRRSVTSSCVATQPPSSSGLWEMAIVRPSAR